MASVIDINNLNINLGGQPVIRDFSVALPAGRIIGVLGPSGAGKTTLLRAIVGSQRITAGSLLVFDLPAGSSKLRRDIGYMTQAAAVYADLTIAENLQYFAAMGGYSRQQAEGVIDEVELTEYAKRLVSNLSGGQQSRVSLAIALLGHPKLLVLDEPTVGVDPVLRKQLWQLFRKLARTGITLLVSSHVMDEASHCDDLLLIREGRLIASGSPAELQARTGTKSMEDSFLSLVRQAQ